MRSMTKPCLLLLAAALLVPAVAATAQEPEPKKYEGTWYQLYQVDFKMGMRDKALEHIEKNFAPAGAKTGTGPEMVLLHHSGDHDMTMLWKLEGGPADLEWERSPDDVKWAKAMAEQHGGMEGLEKAWQDYAAMIEQVDVVLVRSWELPGAGDDAGDAGDAGMDEE